MFTFTPMHAHTHNANMFYQGCFGDFILNRNNPQMGTLYIMTGPSNARVNV